MGLFLGGGRGKLCQGRKEEGRKKSLFLLFFPSTVDVASSSSLTSFFFLDAITFAKEGRERRWEGIKWEMVRKLKNDDLSRSSQVIFFPLPSLALFPEESSFLCETTCHFIPLYYSMSVSSTAFACCLSIPGVSVKVASLLRPPHLCVAHSTASRFLLLYTV